MRASPIAVLALALPMATPAGAADYAASTGSSLGFISTWQDEEITGSFAAFSARLSFDPLAPADCRFDVGITLASVAADMDDAAEMLKGDDFFATATTAEARWSASGCRSLGSGRFAADGRLTLRGVTKPVTLTFEWTPGASPVLTGTATVARLQFGVGGGEWADTGLLLDVVRVETRLVLRTEPPAGAAR